MQKKKEVINIRISSIEKDKWQQCANERGQNLSEFIRFVVNMKVEETLKANHQ